MLAVVRSLMPLQKLTTSEKRTQLEERHRHRQGGRRKNRHPQKQKSSKGRSGHHSSRQHQNEGSNRNHGHKPGRIRPLQPIPTTHGSRRPDSSKSSGKTHVHCKPGHIRSGTDCIAVTATNAHTSSVSTVRHHTKMTTSSSPTSAYSQRTPLPQKTSHPSPSPSGMQRSGDNSGANPHISSSGVSGGVAAGIGMGAAVFIILILLSVLYCLGRRRKRRGKPQNPPGLSPSPAQILGKGERAAPLPEVNRWSKVLPQPSGQEEVPAAYSSEARRTAAAKEGSHDANGNGNVSRNSECTTFTPYLGRRQESLNYDDSPQYPETVQMRPRQIGRSSSIYSLDIPVYLENSDPSNVRAGPRTYRNNSLRYNTADTGRWKYEARDETGEELRGASSCETGPPTPYADKHIITPYMSEF